MIQNEAVLLSARLGMYPYEWGFGRPKVKTHVQKVVNACQQCKNIREGKTARIKFWKRLASSMGERRRY